MQLARIAKEKVDFSSKWSDNLNVEEAKWSPGQI